MHTERQQQLTSALHAHNFDLALRLYLDWFNAESHESALNNWARQHRVNAASLARKKLYDDTVSMCASLPKAHAALAHFVGLKRLAFETPLQQPNFFYYPGLSAKPFYKVEEIEGLPGLIEQISRHLPKRKDTDSFAATSYVDHIGTVPNSKEWQALRQTWQAQHFIVGGKRNEGFEQLPLSFQQAFEHALIPECPPFAPEVFVSVLEPGAYIPPHYGISNVKLTVHVPIVVTDKAWLKAGNEEFRWQGQNCMIFDDSFEHSAKNESTAPRSVLIFDIWHPELSGAEQIFIKKFMQYHQQWIATFGQLANLDKGLH